MNDNTAEVLSGEETILVGSPDSVGAFVWLAVMVAAFGYFVDVFDMWLFANFRVASLTALGVTGATATDAGAYIINCQQAGLLTGGLVWGVLGDKRGRVSVMFGSIFLYSVATLLTAYAGTVNQFALLRAITGFGLAGEIGAGITLISELLPKDKRGYGTTMVATIGVSGAIGAALVGKMMQWQNAYILGSLMGFALLALRLLVAESGMYAALSEEKAIKRGSLKLLFTSGSRVGRFLCCILVGVPIYLVFGLILTFCPEIAASLGIQEKIIVPEVMMFGSIGMTAGDLFSGLLSQAFGSRKKPIAGLMLIAFVLTLLITGGYVTTADGFKYICGLLGLCVGYWACLITATAEQFGTNLRATVTTIVPNLVRGSAILLNLAFVHLKTVSGAGHAAFLITIPVFVLSLIGVALLRETYGRDLKFVER